MEVMVLRANGEWSFEKIRRGGAAIRKLLGGGLEWVEMGDIHLAAYCHGEGKFLGMPENELVGFLRDERLQGQDWIAGTVVITGMNNEGDSCDLTAEQKDHLQKKLEEGLAAKDSGSSTIDAARIEEVELALDEYLWDQNLNFDNSIEYKSGKGWIVSGGKGNELSLSHILLAVRNNLPVGPALLEHLMEEMDSQEEEIQELIRDRYEKWNGTVDVQRFLPGILDSAEFDSYEEFEKMEEEMEEDMGLEGFLNQIDIRAEEIECLGKYAKRFEKLMKTYHLQYEILSDEKLRVFETR